MVRYCAYKKPPVLILKSIPALYVMKTPPFFFDLALKYLTTNFFAFCFHLFFADAANIARFHGARRRAFTLKSPFILSFEKRLSNAVIDKVPGKQFV
jgi:hypothetical protein